MLTTPAPDAEETQANAAFEAALWACSRPGLPRQLPAPGEAALIAALLDRECAAYAGDPLLIPALAQTGAGLVDLCQADHAFLGRLQDITLLGQCRTGSDLYPDQGATLVIRAKFAQGPRIRLTGPGVDGAVVIQLDGLPAGFWQERARLIRYPMGFDIFFLDGECLIGLPRSTKVEVA